MFYWVSLSVVLILDSSVEVRVTEPGMELEASLAKFAATCIIGWVSYNPWNYIWPGFCLRYGARNCSALGEDGVLYDGHDS